MSGSMLAVGDDGRAGLPAPLGPVQPEAYQRAPTLMGGDAPGEQGAVQVWSPDIAALRAQARTMGMLVGIGVSVSIACAVTVHGITGGGLVMPIAVLLASIRALRRPCYLTTDEHGIGLTTSRRSRALRWEQIESLETVESVVITWNLILRSGEKLHLNLTGYPAEARKALLALVSRRANLQPHPRKKFLHIRAPAALEDGRSGDGVRE